MNKQGFLGAAMLSSIGIVTALGLFVAGVKRNSVGMQRAAILAGGLFLSASGLLMWYFSQSLNTHR